MALSNLNEKQYEAATCKNGYNLVIASAGTGKTSTIVGRIAFQLNKGVKPEQIMLVTFTNKASNEMISRVAKFFGKDVSSKIMAGTFHSISYKLLKKIGIKISLKQPSEMKNLFRSIYEKRIFSATSQSTPYDGGYLYDIYSLFLNSTGGGDLAKWLISKNEDQEPFVDIYEDVIAEFNELKNKYNYVNYDDLLLIMQEQQKIGEFDFEEVLVDEYQDTNQLQNKLLLGFKSKGLFCVGDYDQSIYGFNGSDIGIISSFDKVYKDAKIFTLTKNYRSTKVILDLANKVINFNERIYDKKLEVTRLNEGLPPKLLEFDEVYSQYSYIAQAIQSSQTPHDEIAIIYRNNSSADGMEIKLRELDINYKRKGGHSFFDSYDMKFIINLIMITKKSSDVMAFIDVAQYGNNIGKAVAKDIFDALMLLGENDVMRGLLKPNAEIIMPYQSRKSNFQLGLFDDFIDVGSISKFKDLDFCEAFLSNQILKHPKLTKEGGEYLYKMYNILKELKNISKPQNMIEHIEKHSILEFVVNSVATKRAKQKDGSINENIKDSIIKKSTKKVAILKYISKEYSDIDKFINSTVLNGGELSSGAGVSLYSIHASKGLEFKEVYIIDLMDGRFPNRSLMSKGGSLEEERRLFYVAVTRAKDILCLSFAKYDRIKKLDFVPSPFLVEAKLVTK